VFAYEWASLDVISGGRTILAVCSGGGAGPAWDAETAAMGIPPAERRKRMIENIAVLRHLWATNDTPFEGKYFRSGSMTTEPKPLRSPCPIWLATNAGRLGNAQSGTGGSDFALRGVGRVGQLPAGADARPGVRSALRRPAPHGSACFGRRAVRSSSSGSPPWATR
jgi:alkanesulfonate monooxygenase SsuD/methylene tetrahydromethanopterin reductase-like flavin-dependent oxidoreductase (luciferase family)